MFCVLLVSDLLREKEGKEVRNNVHSVVINSFFNDFIAQLKFFLLICICIQPLNKNEMKKNLRRSTLCVQAGWEPKNGEPRVVPIFQSTTFKYDDSEEMAMLKKKDISIRGCKIPQTMLWHERLQLWKGASEPC